MIATEDRGHDGGLRWHILMANCTCDGELQAQRRVAKRTGFATEGTGGGSRVVAVEVKERRRPVSSGSSRWVVAAPCGGGGGWLAGW